MQALEPAFAIVEPEVASNTRPDLRHRIVRLEMHFLVLQATPKALHKHIVCPTAFAVHTDPDASLFEGAGEDVTGELGTLIRVEIYPALHSG